MEAPLYLFKIFSHDPQGGNPAACALFTDWPDTAVLQSIAFTTGQVVTAFVVAVPDTPYQYHIRWFSRQQEINLCGHGTLAAAALLRHLKGEGCYQFCSPYGELKVTASLESLQIVLPQWPSCPAELPPGLLACQPVDYFQTRDLVLVLEHEQAVRQFQADFMLLRTLPQHALIVTAFCPPDRYVLRYFAPSIGINEDIATGSAQCSLAAYWSAKTGLVKFEVRQLSTPTVIFNVHVEEQQVLLTTQAVYV